MKVYFFIFFVLLTIDTFGKETDSVNVFLSVSPVVNREDQSNKAIINALEVFLKTKNADPAKNIHWLESDFKKYVYPYLDIVNIEQSKYGADFYRPTLVDIIGTENPNQKIVKIAFIGHSDISQENFLKSIYNIVANVNSDKVVFSKYLDFATADWNRLERPNINYVISKNRIANEAEMENQQIFVEKLCQFFSCSPISITYFSCINPVELFQIKGFDYNQKMYTHNLGGLAEYGNIIYSGNNSEFYAHEVIHVYTKKLFPTINIFLDEGLATFFGGSGTHNYYWHKKKMAKFLEENEAYDLSKHLDIYESNDFEKETSIPYLTAALIIERTLMKYDNKQLFSILNSDADLWTILGQVGLTKENINSVLRKQVNESVLFTW